MMNKILLAAGFAAIAAAPTAATAQAMPGAVVAVVNLERVTSECTACKTASAALRTQITAYQNRQRSLAQPLETEQRAIQSAIDALKGAQPDAALQTRVRTFQTRQQEAAQQLQAEEQRIQRNRAYIQKQIVDRLNPIYQQVMQRRGANIMVETGATLATATSVDVTNDILAALNTALPSIQTTAPAQAAPQGR